MDPFDLPDDEYIIQSVAQSHEEIVGKPPENIGAILPFSRTGCAGQFRAKLQARS